MSRKAQVKVSTLVAVSPAEAFRVFTEEVDLWWKRSMRFLGSPPNDSYSNSGRRHRRCLWRETETASFVSGQSLR